MACFISDGQLYYRFSDEPEDISKFSRLDFNGIIIQASISLSRIAFIDINNHLWVFDSSYNSSISAYDINETLTHVLPNIQFKYVATCVGLAVAIDIGGNIWYSGRLSHNVIADQFTQLTDNTNFTDISCGGNSLLAVDINGDLYGYGEYHGVNGFVFVRDNVKRVFNGAVKVLCIDSNDDVWISFNNRMLPPNVERNVFYQITRNSWAKDVIISGGEICVLSKGGMVFIINNGDIINGIINENMENIPYAQISDNITQMSRSMFTYLLSTNGKIFELRWFEDGIPTFYEIEGFTADLLFNQSSYLARRRFMTTKSARKANY